MNVLVTGAKGFIGKNLVAELKNRGYQNIYEYDYDSTEEQLYGYTKNCDFVVHLAGVNRPKDEEEFVKGNVGFTSVLLEYLKQNQNTAPILMTSSIQALQENAYGRSKKAGEDVLFCYHQEMGIKVLVYRLPNVFGKWAKPNYNSAVATFCHNIANDLPIAISDRENQIKLTYIDDVVGAFISAMEGNETCAQEGFYDIKEVYVARLGEIVDLIYSFKNSRDSLQIPDMQDPFIKKLYSTFISYLPPDQLSCSLKMNIDSRGSFTEFMKSPDRGQISVNVAKPGITKGNHWHHTKNEKFLVVSGEGVIRLRKIEEKSIVEYKVNGEHFKIVDIPPGYTHNITNTGNTDMVTIMWANEEFHPDRADTYYLEV